MDHHECATLGGRVIRGPTYLERLNLGNLHIRDFPNVTVDQHRKWYGCKWSFGKSHGRGDINSRRSMTIFNARPVIAIN
jgi:hypothetical protein